MLYISGFKDTMTSFSYIDLVISLFLADIIQPMYLQHYSYYEISNNLHDLPGVLYMHTQYVHGLPVCCLCVCVRARMCVCVRACMRACVHACVRACMSGYVQVHVCACLTTVAVSL
jgi:hypothetical protein